MLHKIKIAMLPLKYVSKYTWEKLFFKNQRINKDGFSVL